MMQTALDNYYSEARRFRPDNTSPAHPRAVLLAGGDGVRLRDLTQRITGDSRPKQFCPIMGEESLFRQKRKRIRPLFLSDRHVFVLSRARAPYYAGDLIDAGGSCIIEQPLNRGTGVAMALALLRILQSDPDALIASQGTEDARGYRRQPLVIGGRATQSVRRRDRDTTLSIGTGRRARRASRRPAWSCS